MYDDSVICVGCGGVVEWDPYQREDEELVCADCAQLDGVGVEYDDGGDNDEDDGDDAC